MVYEHLPVILPDSEQIQENADTWWQASSVARILHLAFTRYSHTIMFGPCKGGAVFELRLPEVPGVSFTAREILIDLPQQAGHFHLVLLPPSKDSVAPTSQYAARLALFHGSQTNTAGKPVVYGLRLWNHDGEQLVTLFFMESRQWHFFRSEVFEFLSDTDFGTAILPTAEPASWSLDNAVARIDFYQRLLYSQSFEHRVRAVQALLPEQTRKILQQLPEGLGIERKARHRNLIFTLKRAASFSLLLLTDQDAEILVGEWCDSDVFWENNARNLAESFCLFAWLKLRLSSPLTAELIRLQGVMSGIANAHADTPWREHRLYRQEHTREESWLSAVRLIDEDGSVVFDADGSQREPCYRIHVRHDRGKTSLRAEAL
jgi:hypothetical protein